MANLALYKIDYELRFILEQAADDGLLTDDAIAQAESLELARTDKFMGYCTLITEWQAAVQAREHEIQRLRMANDIDERNIRRLKENLLASMAANDERRFDTPLFKIWRQQNPPAVECTVPEEDYWTLDMALVRTKMEPNKAKAMEIFKTTGEMPAGFKLKEATESLRIK